MTTTAPAPALTADEVTALLELIGDQQRALRAGTIRPMPGWNSDNAEYLTALRAKLDALKAAL